jgi:hypothetical protein
MKLRNTFFIIATAFQLFNCVEQVDIENYIDGKQSNRLVVEGLITNEYKRHMVKLTQTGKVATDQYLPVSGAEVAISDGSNIFPLYENTPGIYLTDSLQGVVGGTYTLNIIAQGKMYLATDEMPAHNPFNRADGFALTSNKPPSGYIQSPLIIFGSNEPALLNIKIDNPQPNDKYTQFTYYAFPGIHPDHLLPKFVEATLSYDEGTQITQTKYSLSDSHYEFLRAVLLETEYNGGVFGSVRADVPTNVGNQAVGFFAACAVIRRTGVIGLDGKLH